jgi:hypothetical protein
MKAIFISFNQAYYEELLALMDKHNIRGYTYWDTVQGRGSKTGDPRYGSHAWPTQNGAILAIVDDAKTVPFLEILHKLDKQWEAQGLRAFVWNIEQTI